MTNGCRWFYSIFDIQNHVDEIMRFKGKSFLSDIWKRKIILDYLETGEYKEFLGGSNLCLFDFFSVCGC